jgi:GT2 family glycosyltransferase
MKKVTAVVLNWNRPIDTVDCVRSLQDSGYPDLDIVVVDNASTDDSVARIQSALPGVPIIRSPINGGYAAGNNLGVRHALANGADYVLILNNDVIVNPGFLQPMVSEAEADPSVGIVTCDARFQSDHSRSYPTGGRISFLRGAALALPRRERSQRMTVDFVSGCILLVRRAVFEAVGLLDESFFMYFEDYEFSRRVASSYQLVYTPHATVYHRSGGGDRWAAQTPTYLHYMARNRFLAFRNESAAYRSYLVLVGSAIAVAKSVAILVDVVRTGRGTTARQQLRALWSGLWAGVRISVRPPKVGVTVPAPESLRSPIER